MKNREQLLPIEVKSADNTRAKSLKVYMETYQPAYAIKLSTKNFGFEDKKRLFLSMQHFAFKGSFYILAENCLFFLCLIIVYGKISIEKFKNIMVYHSTLRQQCRARDGIKSTTQYRPGLRYTQGYYTLIYLRLQQ